jgi:hypothetical protein
MIGYGSPVRIPFPPKKAGFKDRSKSRTRSGRRGRRRFRIEGRQANTRRLREGIHDEAVLYRSWVRWSLLFVLGLTVGAGMLIFPAGRFSVPHFGLIVLFVVSFVAGFNRVPIARATASIILLLGAGAFAATGENPEVGLGIGLSGLGLFLLNSFRM